MTRRVPRRTPETAQAEHLREAFGGATRGRSAVPLPVSRDSKILARLRAGGSNPLPGVLAYQDTFTLTGGAETVELTYLPLTFSEHAYLNGVYQREGDSYDWTRDSGTRTVNVLAPMDARAGDIFIVEYLYYAGLPSTPSPLASFPTGPLFWYKFDETSGTSITDYGSMAFDGTLGSQGTLGGDPIAPLSAKSLITGNKGASSFYVGSSAFFNNTVSQGVWFQSSDVDDLTITTPDLSSTWRYWGLATGTYVGFSIPGTTVYSTEVLSSELADGDPHLFVTTFSGTSLKIYLDGVHRDTVTWSESQKPWFQDANYGCRVYNLGSGKVDDLAGWSRVLTDDEIAAWYGG